MKRVYRLLRNNREYGPFTIDELLGQSLRATDMLWIEGKSSAWAYLSEFELNPATSKEEIPVLTAPDKPQTDEIERKAEEIRKRVMHHPHPIHPVEHSSVDGTHFYIPTADEEVIEFVDHRKRKSTAVNDVLMTALIVALFAGSLYGSRTLLQPQSSKTTPATGNTTVTTDQHAAKSQVPVQEQLPLVVDSTSEEMIAPPPDVTPSHHETAAHVNRTKDSLSQPVKSIAISNPAPDTTTKSEVVKADQTEKKEEVTAKNNSQLQEKQKQQEDGEKLNEPKEEKKKGFFKKLFSKKKKED